MQFDPNSTRDFFPLWKKYKPAILFMMKEAAKGPQQYSFQKHEFDDLNPKKTSAYSFKFSVTSGLRASATKKSLLAEDLLMVLKGSEKAIELVESSEFDFELDKEFKLHVSARPLPEGSTTEEPQADETPVDEAPSEEVTTEQPESEES